MTLGQGQINGGLLEIPMSQQHLNGAQIGPPFEQLCGVQLVPQAIGYRGSLITRSESPEFSPENADCCISRGAR